jgi:hypothetical protein
VVVRDFDVVCAISAPSEADTELVINPDRVLARSITLHRLKAIAGGHTEIVEAGGDLELPELAPSGNLDIGETPHTGATRQSSRDLVLERRDHG